MVLYLSSQESALPKDAWNWPSGSVGDENVKSLQTDGQRQVLKNFKKTNRISPQSN